ncbi:hypothetical protein AWN88_22580 [Agrobacterium tumefaciens]|nr:hypothetical protein AWN88_22580 [Agrobacterium tumefaciens]KAJ35060.1 hypothetical protein BW45_00155 [Agrobacterium tumefaciens]
MSFASQSIFGDHELVQASVLDTSRVSQVTLSPLSASHTFTLDPKTVLVEIRVIGPDMVGVEFTDAQEQTALLLQSERATYSVKADSRNLAVSVGSVVAPTADTIVQILET